MGAVSTIGAERRRNTPGLARYVGALAAGRTPPREIEALDGDVRSRERVMLGLRLDEPLALAGLEASLDTVALAKLERLGLAARAGADEETTLALTRRGRFLGGGVTAELLA